MIFNWCDVKNPIWKLYKTLLIKLFFLKYYPRKQQIYKHSLNCQYINVFIYKDILHRVFNLHVSIKRDELDRLNIIYENIKNYYINNFFYFKTLHIISKNIVYTC